jgi:hypothetical protein
LAPEKRAITPVDARAPGSRKGFETLTPSNVTEVRAVKNRAAGPRGGGHDQASQNDRRFRFWISEAWITLAGVFNSTCQTNFRFERERGDAAEGAGQQPIEDVAMGADDCLRQRARE